MTLLEKGQALCIRDQLIKASFFINFLKDSVDIDNDEIFERLSLVHKKGILGGTFHLCCISKRMKDLDQSIIHEIHADLSLLDIKLRYQKDLILFIGKNPLVKSALLLNSHFLKSEGITHPMAYVAIMHKRDDTFAFLNKQVIPAVGMIQIEMSL